MSTVQVGASIARRFVLEREEEYDLPGVQRFVARDTRLDREVNVDIVTAHAPSAVVGAAGRARVLRDKRVARVLAAGRERHGEGRVDFVVSERPLGVNLSLLLGSVAFEPHAAAAIVGEAAAALTRAALVGEHHGLIRPEALAVTDRGRVMVSGFGVDGELAVQAGASKGRTERADAIALAQVFLTAITGMEAEKVNLSDLPDDLSPSALKLAKAAIKGSGPKTLADVTAALGLGDAKVLRSVALEAPALWWPAAPVLAIEAPPAVAEIAAAAPVVTEAPVVEAPVVEAPVVEAPVATDEVAVEEIAVEEAPAAETTAEVEAVETEDVVEGELLATDVAIAATGTDLVTDDLVDAEIVTTDEIPVARPLTRFGKAVDDIDEFHDIVSSQSQTTKPTVAEATLLWLQERFPESEQLARAKEAAHRRAQVQAPINAGPLLVGLAITAVFVVAIIATSTIGRPVEIDGDRYNNPQATYPEFTFGPSAPPSTAPSEPTG